MSAITGFAVGVGISVGFAAVYLMISYKQDKCIQSRNRRQTSLQRRHKQDELCRQDQVEAIEKQFFKGIGCILRLTEGQIYQLKTLLKGSTNSENKDWFENCQNLQDILMSMKTVHLITPGRYRCITAILTEAGIDASRITWHIEKLTNAIEDFTNGSEPRGFEADPFDYDAVIIHCDKDREMVKMFIKNSEEKLNIPGLSICLFEEFKIAQPNLLSIVDVLSVARYVYVFVTPDLTRDTFNRFMTILALTDSLQIKERNWRIIPIWATKSIVNIPELGPISGLKYWQFSDQTHKDDFLKSYKNHILEGRKTINQASARCIQN